ncbi:MAG: FtsX-like permease family protein [Chitinophagaceae bacterium]|nr:MAG: FtsX-like permease family protein [Chitinophagaceae bacterium]
MKTDVRLAIRNLKKNQLYTTVNIAGLGVASAFIILVALYVRHGILMDKFHAKANSIVRIEMSSLGGGQPQQNSGLFSFLKTDPGERNMIVLPVGLAGDIKNNFPEVRSTVRIKPMYEPVIRYKDKTVTVKDKAGVYIDTSFFSMFDFPIVKGSSSRPFTNNNSVVLSKEFASQLFGAEDPIGKTISVNNEPDQLFIVSAVTADFPSTSSFNFDFMLPVEGARSYPNYVKNGTRTMSHFLLVELASEASLPQFAKKLNGFAKVHFAPLIQSFTERGKADKVANLALFARPFLQAHINPATPWFYYTDIVNVNQLITLALIALLIACVNHVLLSISNITSRSQEIGVRKTIGAGTKHILKGYFVETQLLVLLAMIVAVLLAVIALPWFNELTGVTIPLDEILSADVAAFLLLFALSLCLISGIYPAIKLIGLQPLKMLRRHSTSKMSVPLSHAFVGVQYVCCVVLITFAIVIAKQMRFMSGKELGFDKEHVISVQSPFRFNDEKTLDAGRYFSSFTATNPVFTDFTATGFKFDGGYDTKSYTIQGAQEMVAEIAVDFNYFDFNNIPILSGRAFSAAIKSDSVATLIPKEMLDSMNSVTRSHVVVNETLYRLLGSPELNTINKMLGSIIIGVSKDYHIDGLEKAIIPAYHICRPQSAMYLWFRIAKNQDLGVAVNKLEAAFSAYTNGEAFKYSFVDDDVAATVLQHQRWMKIISAASALAIFIACLGLFGLSAIMAVNRIKEIGIRKVMGAGVGRIFVTLNTQTFFIVLLSVFIAIPLSSYIANSWLEGFAYRISLDYSVFVWAGFTGLVCALIAVSFHTFKAALANPVHSLRSE